MYPNSGVSLPKLPLADDKNKQIFNKRNALKLECSGTGIWQEKDGNKAEQSQKNYITARPSHMYFL